MKQGETAALAKPNDKLGIAGLKGQVAHDSLQLQLAPTGTIMHHEVLSELLSQVKTVNFLEKAKLADGQSLKTRHYLIIVVEEILALALHNKWGLCRSQHLIYVYNGAFWQVISQDDLKAFLRQAAEDMGIEKFTSRYVRFANQLLEQFEETAYLPTPTPDRRQVKINMKNGTFVIDTQRQLLRAPKAADFLTYQLPFSYSPDATAPLFRAFLNHVLPDPDCQKVLAEYLGYLFVSSGKLKIEKALLLYGSGANGKSVIFEVVTALLGEENICNYSLKSLTVDPAYCRVHLANKLVNYASEISGNLETAAFKALTSNEPIEARMIHQEPFTIRHYAKLIFNCNKLPVDVEHTNAFFRRFLILPFTVEIPEDEQDKQLATKIIESELSGVFNWVLSGLHRLLAQGKLTDCEAARKELDAFKKQSDSVQLFLDDRGYKRHPEQYTSLKTLYPDYKSFCFDNGYKPVNSQNFGNRLIACGLRYERKSFGNVIYVIQATQS